MGRNDRKILIIKKELWLCFLLIAVIVLGWTIMRSSFQDLEWYMDKHGNERAIVAAQFDVYRSIGYDVNIQYHDNDVKVILCIPEDSNIDKSLLKKNRDTYQEDLKMTKKYIKKITRKKVELGCISFVDSTGKIIYEIYD